MSYALTMTVCHALGPSIVNLTHDHIIKEITQHISHHEGPCCSMQWGAVHHTRTVQPCALLQAHQSQLNRALCMFSDYHLQ